MNDPPHKLIQGPMLQNIIQRPMATDGKLSPFQWQTMAYRVVKMLDKNCFHTCAHPQHK